MKNILRYLLPAAGLAAALPLARADDPAPTPKAEQHELRVISSPDHATIFRHIASGGEKEKVTFLGIETSSVSPTIIAQLGLTDGVGLVVNHVVADTPAASVLKVHDILLKLDDQLLIEQRQLSVLVRGHKEGDEVTLTYLRGGKQATAKVKLVQHEVPKVSLLQGHAGVAPFALTRRDGSAVTLTAHSDDDSTENVPDAEEVDRVLSLIDSAKAPGVRQMSIVNQAGPGDRSVSVTVNTANSHVVLKDDEGSLDLTIKEGKKELIAKNAKGDPLFSGPIDTPEQRKALPDVVRTRLEKIEDTSQFSFKTGAEFQGSETKVLRGHGQSILMSRPETATLRPALFL